MNVGVNFSYPVFLYTEYSLYLVSGFTHKKIKDYYLDGLVSNEKARNSVNLGIERTYRGLENNVLSYTLILYMVMLKMMVIFLDLME